MVGSRQWSRGAGFSSSPFAAELGRADFQLVGCWVGYDSRRLPSAVGGASSSPWEPIPPRPPDTGDSAVGSRLSVESRSSLRVYSVGCPCHKLGGFGILHGCDFSARIDGSTSSRFFHWLGEFYPAVDSADFAAGDQDFRWFDIQIGAQVSGQGCRWVISSSAAFGGQRIRWSSDAANSAARATSAFSPLVIASPSPPVVTPTPHPVGASSSQRQSSSDDSTDDEVALQRSRRLRKKSIVESDESSDSVAEALEEKPASPLIPASVSPAPSTGQKRPSSPVAPASTKKARASASAKSSSPPRPVTKSTSRFRPTAKSSKAAKSATKTARGLPMLAQVPWRSPRDGQGVRCPLRAHALARRFKRRSRSPPRPESGELG
ncbi:unnamed protein product [Phytophthora fragariaefolia]|uniref:Unnamed protein product n=1 Tax=Phytophthora fragariaefolia TaxID=1490495 RepID=A0A9W6Y4R0_9STRA|nr:unnamed protein product [Phytophthora fragariaefolia]